MSDSPSALLALLPDAEPLLTRARSITPDCVRPLPAHVSILYPGPPAETDADSVHDLGRVLPRNVELTSMVRGQDGFLALAIPECLPCIEQARRSWPDITPYGGRYGESPTPHMTVALNASEEQVEQLLDALAPLLPIRSRVIGPHLVQQSPAGRWEILIGPGQNP